MLVEWTAAGLCHSDEHLVTGDMVLAAEIAGDDGLAALPDRRRPRGRRRDRRGRPGRHHRAAGRPRVATSSRRAVAAASARPATRTSATSAPGCLPAGDDHRRHLPPPRSARQRPRTCSPSSAPSPSTACGRGVGHQGRPRPPARHGRPGVAAASPPGWGSAVYAAEVQPGETVVVVGIGGIGMNAVQGAALAGAQHVIAVDPVEFKREKAQEFGATHTVASHRGGDCPLVTELTWGADGRQGDPHPRRGRTAT